MTATASLARLRSLRNRYDAAALREQRALLRALDRLPLRRWREVEALHEDLLFLCAFAGSAGIAREARARLASIGSRLRALPKHERGLGNDTGIAGSVTRHVYPFPIARWLARTEDLAIDWGGVGDETALDNVVRLNLVPAAAEAFDDGEYGTREFVGLARPAWARSDVSRPRCARLRELAARGAHRIHPARADLRRSAKPVRLARPRSGRARLAASRQGAGAGTDVRVARDARRAGVPIARWKPYIHEVRVTSKSTVDQTGP